MEIYQIVLTNNLNFLIKDENNLEEIFRYIRDPNDRYQKYLLVKTITNKNILINIDHIVCIYYPEKS